MKKWLIVALFIAPMISEAQELARRAFLGVLMEPLTDDVRRVTQFKETNGVLVRGVVPGSTAEAAGFLKGDILVELGGQTIASTGEAVEVMRQYREGQKLNYKLFRKGKFISKSTVVKGLVRENFKGIETIYSDVLSGQNHLRTILSKPKNKTGKLPAILFIQGVGCYSMDTPMDTLRTEYQLLNGLVRSGYAVMRVDKPGMGDSKGVSCAELDFNTELDCYKAAFNALQKDPAVDPDNVFIIGHSMGGVMAPLLARDYKVKGIVAYGTIGVNFMEYYANSRRTVAQAYQMNATETDDFVKLHCECASMIIAQRMTKEEVQQKNTECANTYDDYLFRAKNFWYQLYEQNMPNAWETYTGKVLAAWGGSDYVSTRQEHEYIADVVNRAHPGNGTYTMVPQSSHGFTLAGNFADAQKDADSQKGVYNPEVGKIFLSWLNKQSSAR